MPLLRCFILLQTMTTFALGQFAYQSQPTTVSGHADEVVRSLYREVVLRHPVGIPKGADMTIFSHYLSKALLQRMDEARACYKDWLRGHPDPHLKPPFGWLEAGLFSGDDEQASPRDFQIEGTESEKDHMIRVYVKLTWEKPPAPKWIWRVAAIVKDEDGRLAVDDVIYLNDENRSIESRLSGYLSTGCEGPRWIRPRK